MSFVCRPDIDIVCRDYSADRHGISHRALVVLLLRISRLAGCSDRWHDYVTGRASWDGAEELARGDTRKILECLKAEALRALTRSARLPPSKAMSLISERWRQIAFTAGKAAEQYA